MFNSDMLEAAVGLIFIYLLFSFVATAMRESLEAWAKTRGAMLEQGILGLFQPPGAAPGAPADSETVSHSAEALLNQLYQTPAIFSLFRGPYLQPSDRPPAGVGSNGMARRLPSYIPAENFAQGLIKVVEAHANPGAGGAHGSLDRLWLALEGVENHQVRESMRAALKAGGGDPGKVSAYIEAWYTTAMDRLSGLYRRKTQWIVLLGTLVVSVGLNVNTITIVQSLTQQRALREAVAASATLTAADSRLLDTLPAGSTELSPRLKKQIAEVRELGLPIGWDDMPRHTLRDLGQRGFVVPFTGGWVLQVGWLAVGLGWLMTALAISLGAPFWFDVLSKVMVVRATAKPPATAAPKAPTPAARKATVAGGAQVAAPAGPVAPAAASPITEADRAEIAGLDPAERPREDD